MLQNNIPQKAEQYAKKQGRRRVWQRIVMTLACVVVFCTTYALIIPAITMERAPSCGIEDHQHTEFCYEARLICGFGEAHTHSEGCYADQQLLICTQQESSGHIHSDVCIRTEQTQICTQEHDHAPECFTSVSTYICAMAEGEGAHTHDQQCYETKSPLTCTIPEQQSHDHTDGCYENVLICQKQEHFHSDACYPPVTEATEQTTEATVETTIATEETTIATEETTIATEETTIATEETTEATEDPTEATEEQTEPEEVQVPRLEPFVYDVFFSDTVYDAAADHFDTLMHVSFRIPVSVISVGELYACNYQLPGNLTPAMWGPANFHFGSAYASSGVRAGSFVLTYEGGRCLSVLSFDRNAISGDTVDGNFSFAAAISRSALQEDGTIRLTLSNGVGVSISAPEMPTAETEPTEETTEATTEPIEETTETTEATEETTEPTEVTEETTEPTEEITEATEETTEATEETTEPTEVTEETTEPTEETTEATEETTETTEETTESTEETTEATEETTETTEETTESTEETTEATEEPTEATDATTEPTGKATEPTEEAAKSTRKSLKDALRDLVGLGAFPEAINETGATTELLPKVELDGRDTTFNPTTDQFTTTVRIDFRFDSETVAPTAGTHYIYTYPAGVVIPAEVVAAEPQNLYDNGKYAGTYDFIANADGTYSVVIIFDETYIRESGDTVDGFVQFDGSFSREDMNQQGDIVVGGDNAVVLVPGNEITYPDDETESYHIDVKKEGTWVRDGDNLVYTVYVRTLRGTPDPINLKDTITIPAGLALGDPAVTVEKGTATYNYQSWNNTWSATDSQNLQIVPVEPTYSNGELALFLPALSFNDIGNNSATGDFYKITYTYHIDSQSDPTVSVDNAVQVRASDETKGQTVTDSAQTTVRVDKDFSHTLDKSGQVDPEKRGYIKWTVIVNKNAVDIAGATLTDDMLGLVENATDITVYPHESADINRDPATGKITHITFVPLADGKNTEKYTITYYTPVTESWDGSTVNNNAKFDPDPDTPNDEKEVTASVTVNGVKMNKQGQFDGTNNRIVWTITVNSGNLDIAGATLTDAMFTPLSEAAFTINPTTGYQFIQDDEGKITGITFPAGDNCKNTQTYTIQYFTDVPSGSTAPVTNTAVLTPGIGVEGTPIGSTDEVKPDELQMTKSGNYWDNQIYWTITVNASRLNIAGAVLTDGMFGKLAPGDIRIQKNWGENITEGEYTINTVTVDGNERIASIQFNVIGNTGVNTNQYTITYTTTEYQQWSTHTVHNEAKLTLEGREVPSIADVPIPPTGSVAKSSGAGTVSTDGKTMTIPWTVTLDIPKGGLPAGTTIVDDVTRNQWGNTNSNQWMTRSQITTWATNLLWTDSNGNPAGGNNTYTNPPAEQVTFLATDGNTYTYKQISEYSAPAGSGGVNYEELRYTLFTIYFPDGLTPPEGATKLTFTYSTTVDLTQTSIGGNNKFYNYIDAGGKPASADYTYYKPGVVKTDGNGRTDDTIVSNEGELTWKVVATVGQGNKKLTLIDTLPDGVILESLQLTGRNNLNMTLDVAADGTITGTDSSSPYAVSGTMVGRAISVVIQPKNSEADIQTGAVFNLIVNCRVEDAEKRTDSLSLTNYVEMKLDEQSIGTSSQTQQWSYLEEVIVAKAVDKSGGWDNNNRRMDYAIVLNPDALDLVEGVDTLTLVDTMTYSNEFTLYYPFDGTTYHINATLIPGSVELYEAVWNEQTGKWDAGGIVSGWSWTYGTVNPVYSWDHDVTNTITATGIPDGRRLMLKYSYWITTNAPEMQGENRVEFNHRFENTARLEGTNHSDSNENSRIEWKYSGTSAGVTTDKSYTFYKVEAGNYNVPLSGAVFSVYRYDDTDMTTPVKAYTTASGSFQILRQEKDSNEDVTFEYDYNTLYKVMETAPPDGYLLPDEVPVYVFYFSNAEDTAHILPDNLPSDAVNLSDEAKYTYVENVRNITSIQVNKQWLDSTGQTIVGSTESLPDFIAFYLTRTANGTTERVGSDGVIGSAAQSYTLTKANNWTMTIENLPMKDGQGNTYTYSVEEVTVNGYSSTVSVNGTTITITNTKTPAPTPTELTVNKVWKKADGTEDLTVGNGYSVTVKLAQVAATTTGGTSHTETRGSSSETNGKLTILDSVDRTNPNLSLRITYNQPADKKDWGYAGFRRIDSSGYVNWNVVDLTLEIKDSAAGQRTDTVPLSSLPWGDGGVHFQFWGDNATFVSMELVETVITGGQTNVTVNKTYDTRVLTSANNWSHTWYNLPAGDGSTTYTYYVTEAGVTNGSEENFANLFNVSVDHGNQSTAIGPSGNVTITNTLKSTYTLPETGGGGTKPYTLGGLLLCITAGALLLYNNHRRRKEDFPSS